MFGVVVAAGIRTLGQVDYERKPANLSVVAITLACALMPVIMPNLLAKLPAALQPFVHSSVIISCVVSVFLNLLLNGVPTRDDDHELAVTGEHVPEV